ncbi:hypothetical protein GME_08894 [Halomonas sp. TD01]|nr:hypothetical protein GME_08894 [Halomonas sp. TD01]
MIPHMLVTAETVGEHQCFIARPNDGYIIPSYDPLLRQHVSFAPLTEIANFIYQTFTNCDV